MNESIFKDCWIPDPTNQGLGYILTLDCIPVLVGNLILWALIFAGVAALIFIIFSGIKFITSGGDPKQVEGARKTLTFAIAGLVLILLSFAILRFIATATNLGCITEFGFKTCEISEASRASCTSEGGVCRRDVNCPVGHGIATPIDGWSDCSSEDVCCSTSE